MADYYPLIARAVAGLEKNTGEARRALYERARTALVEQLRGMDPALTESEITRERLSLEEAIRKVEAEAARRPRMEAPRPDPLATVRPGEAARSDDERAGSAPVRPSKPGPEAPLAAPERRPEAPRGEPGNPPRAGLRPRSDRPGRRDEGLKGFRDVAMEAEGLGEKTAQAARSVREAYASTPPSSHEFDRLEPRLDADSLRPSAREPIGREPMGREPHPSRLPEPPRPPEGRGAPARPQPPRKAAPVADDREEPSRVRKGLTAALLTVFIIVALGGAAFWQRDRIAGIFSKAGPATPAQKDAGPSRPKITDRIGQDSQNAGSGPSAGPGGQVASVAQRVVLYEEEPGDAAGKRYIGSAIWRTETIPSGAGQPPELAVRADVEIPERRMTMTLSLRRNADQALPASHTLEVTFNLPADFPFGGISNVPGILMKQAEQTRGAPLAGLAVKVTSGFFLVGLSAVEADLTRNLQLLKERSWFDIPVVYNNGRRAILALEKGTPGERAFEEAFKAWGQ